MNRRFVLPWALGLVVVPPCVAGIPTNHFTITARGSGGAVEYLTAAGGQLALGPSSFRTKGDGEDAPDRWFILGTQIKCSVGGGYLSYDPTGADDTVRLVPKPQARGTDWIVRRPEHAKRSNESAGIDEEWGLIQAASGPMKGWYLDVEDRREGGPEPITVRRFVLRKAPAWNFEAGRIYRHL